MATAPRRGARDVLTRQLEDADFRAEWERLVPARAVAQRLVGYRIEHGLSRMALARMLGLQRSAVARLGSGEHLSTLDTLVGMARTLGIEVLVDIRPRGQGSSWVSPDVAAAKVKEETAVGDDAEILVAVG